MHEYEIMQKKKGLAFIQSSKEYNKHRENLLAKLCEINAVANTIGKGRDDFKIDILLKAEEISRKVTLNESKAVRMLAQQIKNTF